MNFYGSARLTADPVVKDVNGTLVCNFSVANNEVRKVKDSNEKQEIVHFFDCIVWDSAAKYLAENAKKGTKLSLEGKIRQERWEKDNKKMSKVVLRVEKFEIFPPYIATNLPKE